MGMKGFLSRLAARSIAPDLSGLRPRIGSLFEPASGQPLTSFLENRWIMPSEDPLSGKPEIEEEQRVNKADISADQDVGMRTPTANAKTQTTLRKEEPVHSSSVFGQTGDKEAHRSEQSGHLLESHVIAKVTSSKDQIEDDNASLSGSQDSGDRKSMPSIGSLTGRPLSSEITSDSSSVGRRNLPEKEASLPGIENVDFGDYRGNIRTPTRLKALGRADNTDTGPGTGKETDTSLGSSKSPGKSTGLRRADGASEFGTHINPIQPSKALDFRRPLNSGIKRAGLVDFLRPEKALAEPEIHVTIGRIDVKAVQQESRPQKREPAPKVMSLNEYLSQRSR